MRIASLSFQLLAAGGALALVACTSGSVPGADGAMQHNDATSGPDAGSNVDGDTGTPPLPDGAMMGGDVGNAPDVQTGTPDTGITTCPTGETLCAGACFNLAYSMLNCGVCGHACPTGEPCVAGSCFVPVTMGCPGPPAGVTANAAAALTLENQVRQAMGIGCATMVTAANLSAARHCAYYAANQSQPTCIANAHVEVSTCSMYVAAQFYDRMTAAGYSGSPAFEDMAFQDDGAAATQQWIDSVYHRTPILSPWVADIGYGSAPACDTMDFGIGAAAPDSAVAMYPYAGQIGVPTSFDGTTEGPTPPAPPTPPGGSPWPSGYPIHVYLRGGTVATHTLTVQSSGVVLPHVWIDGPSSPSPLNQLLADEYVLYANRPLSSGVTYRVQITGTRGGGGGALSLDWTFTTR